MRPVRLRRVRARDRLGALLRLQRYRWRISAARLRRDHDTAKRSRYSTPQELHDWRLRMALDGLRVYHDQPDSSAFESEADTLERLTQQQELAESAS
ncbi:hypothetical protein OG871_27735 [Kitasatospora sp. NBC_00374]|uniref:hypothetical protein n=1 Tax=Kitasatospora sp. NBC_00374 TaxID=2975964 RepID=UPI0030E53BE5